jgi:hypothetical protein
MRGRFGVSGSADKFLAQSAGWKQPGFFAEAFGFLGETFFKGLISFETAARLHGNSPGLAGPNPHGSALPILICRER